MTTTTNFTPAELREIQCRRAEMKPITRDEVAALQAIEFAAPDLLAALIEAAALIDVTRVVSRRRGEHDAANMLDTVSKAAWAAVAKARGEG